MNLSAQPHNIDPRTFFSALFSCAVAAADPEHVIGDYLPERPKGRTVVIGAGKGAGRMAAAFERAWKWPIDRGLVVTRYGYGTACRRIEVIEAAHPVPNQAGLDGSQRLFEVVSGLTEDDLVVALMSGGGSSLLAAPPEGMGLADEIAVNEALLASGAPISVMNTVRKHLSTIKGGRLALATHPAKVVTLVVSDIPGDDPALVASGPTVPSPSTREEALECIERYRLDLPEAALRHLRRSEAAVPHPEDTRFARNSVTIIASAAGSLEAAAQEAKAHGINAVILSDSIEGEAKEVAKVHAALAREIAMRDRPFARPVLLLSGGETTVSVRNRAGRGGRNSEFMLAFALAIEGVAGIDAFAADTDGVDGSEDNAGAFADASTATRMRAAGIDPVAALARNDAWGAFEAVAGLFVTGPTGTNVNDLRMVLVR